MNQSFWTIFQKEWLTVYKDRRSLITNLLIFGVGFPLGAFLPYLALMFSMLNQLSQPLKVAVNGLEHAPRLVNFVQMESKDDLYLVPVSDVEAAVRSQEYLVGLVIPPEFESNLAAYQPTSLEMFTSRGRILDTYAGRVSDLLRDFREDLLARRMREKNLPAEFIKPFTLEVREVQTESRFQRSMAGWAMVTLLVAYGLSVGMTKAVSTTAGEKEHLTMEVLMLSPANRAGIVLGKAAFILTYGLASLLLAFTSMMLMFALVMYILIQKLKLSATDLVNNLNKVYGAPTASGSTVTTQELVAALLVIILLAFFCLVIFTLLQMMVGLWARNESQANNILVAVTLLPGAISLLFFSDTYVPPLWHYAVPMLGQILLMPDLLVNRWEAGPLVVTLISSVATIGLFLWLTVWMLRQETITSRM